MYKKKIREILESEFDTIDINKVDEAKELSQQGLDSLDFFTLIFKIQEEFDIEIPESDTQNCNTIDKLNNYLIIKKT
jgi:acyl carrier protein